jgi:hypothetical protein
VQPWSPALPRSTWRFTAERELLTTRDVGRVRSTHAAGVVAAGAVVAAGGVVAGGAVPAVGGVDGGGSSVASAGVPAADKHATTAAMGM